MIVCLPCWRQRFSISADPPTWNPGHAEARCVLCERPTTAGINVPTVNGVYSKDGTTVNLNKDRA